MTVDEFKRLKVGDIVLMGRYHWKAIGKNTLGEMNFVRADDNSIKMQDAIFIAHLLKPPVEGYVLPEDRTVETEPAEEDPPVVKKKAKKTKVEEDPIDEIEIPKKKPRKKRTPKVK